MFDFHTAMQIALSPVVTLSVIAALAILLAAQSYLSARRTKERLREQAKRLGIMTGALLEAAIILHKRDTERQIGRAIGAAFDAMKNIGFDKLASGEVEFEGVMFGDTPFKSSRRRDPFAEFAFSMDDLKDALRPGEGPNGEKYAGGGRVGGDPFAGEGNGGIRPEPVKNTGDDGAGFGDKGPRPYHFTGGARSPRAG